MMDDQSPCDRLSSLTVFFFFSLPGWIFIFRGDDDDDVDVAPE